ncbi:hypothetical protein RN001_010412 [Aquatica leii]|uniref:CRAL-TRIO domain-containing protein n=1 Tax=Aquatica leii TaxID=1421715 RepID=A0AAN7S8K2_9COLE|nr:hypothetical protein RN001_010412 [Aquatica leii]
MNLPKRTAKKEVEALKKWCTNLPHLKFNADEEWLMVFLYSCKFNVEKAKTKIETFYIMRQVIPELFTNRDPNLPKIQEIIKKGIVVPIKQSETHQKTILYFSFGDPDRYPIVLLLKTYYMILDVLLMDEATKFFEYDLLIDLKGFSAKYEEELTPNMIKILLRYFEDGYPLNVKHVHFINPPPYAMPTLNLVLMFVPGKKRAKIHVHCENEDFDVTSIYPLLGPVFNTDQEGVRRVFNDVCVEWKLKMDDYRKWLMQNAFLFTLDLAQRPEDGNTFLNPFNL